MANRTGAWDFLLKVVQPDFALLQEAQVLPGRAGHVCWQPIGENSVKYGKRGRYRWGSAVWAREHEVEGLPLKTFRGWVQAVRTVDPPCITLISIHVELDTQGRSVPMLHRILSDITPLVETTDGWLILGGDLNADKEFDRRHENRRHHMVFERIEDFGLWHCNRLIAPGRRQTFRGIPGVMDDHLFVSRSMMDRVVACEVLADANAPGDHYPLVLEVEVP